MYVGRLWRGSGCSQTPRIHSFQMPKESSGKRRKTTTHIIREPPAKCQLMAPTENKDTLIGFITIKIGEQRPNAKRLQRVLSAVTTI
jgi:hypothetical protein